MPSVLPIVAPSRLVFDPLLAQEASYFAASARMASLPRVSKSEPKNQEANVYSITAIDPNNVTQSRRLSLQRSTCDGRTFWLRKTQETRKAKSKIKSPIFVSSVFLRGRKITSCLPHHLIKLRPLVSIHCQHLPPRRSRPSNLQFRIDQSSSPRSTQ